MPDPTEKTGFSLLAAAIGASGFDDSPINAKAGFEDSEGALPEAKLKAGFALLAESDVGTGAAAERPNMFDAVEVAPAKSDVLGSSFGEVMLPKRPLLLGFSSVEEAPKALFAGGSEASDVLLKKGRLVLSTVEASAAPNEGLTFSSVAGAALAKGFASDLDTLEALNKGFGASAMEVMEVDAPGPKSGLESPFQAAPDPNIRAAGLFSLVDIFAQSLVSEGLSPKGVEEPVAGPLGEGGKSPPDRWPLAIGTGSSNSTDGVSVEGLEPKAPDGPDEGQAAEGCDAVADLAMFNAGFGSSEDSIGLPMDLKNTFDAAGAGVVSAFDSELDSAFASVTVAALPRLTPPKALDSDGTASEAAGVVVVLASSLLCASNMGLNGAGFATSSSPELTARELALPANLTVVFVFHV